MTSPEETAFDRLTIFANETNELHELLSRVPIGYLRALRPDLTELVNFSLRVGNVLDKYGAKLSQGSASE